MRVQEIERKYDVDADFELPALGHTRNVAGTEQIEERQLEGSYYDTDELHLARRGVTLRQRTGGSDPGWHLKRPSGPGVRTELREPQSDEAGGPPAAFDDELRVIVRDRPIRQVVRITTRRTEHLLKAADGTTLAVVSDDDVSAQLNAGMHKTADRRGRQNQWREVEVELVDGSSETLDAVEDVLLANGARTSSAPSKLARALDGCVPEPFRAGDWSAVAAYLQAQRDAIVGLDPGVRRDDPEAVHKMRVACRRLRSTLRTFRQVLDAARTEPLRTELRWLAGELGQARDAEVMATRLQEQIAGEPSELVIGPVARQITERFAAEASRGHAVAVAALDSPRYTALLDQLDEIVDSPPPADVTTEDLRAMAKKAVRRVDRRLAHALALPDNPPPAQALRPPVPGVVDDRGTALHEARKAAKRARYAAEALTPVGGKPARRLAKSLKRLQDVLGVYQDSVITREILREQGVRTYLDGENAFTYGLLHARQHAAAENALRQLPTAWKKARRTKARSWLS